MPSLKYKCYLNITLPSPRIGAEKELEPCTNQWGQPKSLSFYWVSHQQNRSQKLGHSS